MELYGRIIRDPKICGGQPVFKGTRVTLKTVLASLAEGASNETILSDFPSLSSDDLFAAIRFFPQAHARLRKPERPVTLSLRVPQRTPYPTGSDPKFYVTDL